DEVRAPCGDYHDRGCIVAMFKAAMQDQLLFPPRCCRKRIPLASVQQFLSAELVESYQAKEKESGTLKDVYCTNPSCSLFLCAQVKGALWRCCRTHTCSHCRGAVHPGRGHRCEHDSGQKAVLELASQKGWARCPACDQMIELRSGCYHMT
ncbi:predicted protein, partial [Postia placenta Mad-698-R]